MPGWEFRDDFAAGRARPEWRFDDANTRVETGALVCLGGRASFWLKLPEPAYGAMEVEFDLLSRTRVSWMAALGAYHFNFGGNMAAGSSIQRDQRLVCRTEETPLRPGTAHHIRLAARDPSTGSGPAARVTMWVDGIEFLGGEDTGAMQWLDGFALLVWGDARISGFALKAVPLPRKYARNPAEGTPCELAMCVDFPDDLILYAARPYTPAMFNDMFDRFRQWGVRHVDWIYYRDFTPLASVRPAATEDDRKTERQREIIPDLLPFVTRLAHERGIKLYVQYKIFDQIGRGPTPADSRGLNLLPLLGDRCSVLPEEVERDALLKRNMSGIPPDAEKKIVRRVRLVNRDDRAPEFGHDDLEVWVSDDNRAYRRLPGGSFTVRRGVEERPVLRYDQPLPRPTGETGPRFVLTIEGLNAAEPYLAIVTPKRETAGTLGNRLFELIELLDDQDRRISFTFGEETGASSGFGGAPDFRTSGIDFDVGAGMKGFLLGGDLDVAEMTHFVDNPKGFIGVAKGKNPYVYMLDPSEPGARQHWLRDMLYCLAAGADGMDVRYRAHVKSFEWLAYGFNRPIVEEYRRRYGVDILAEPPDRTRWRELRGEFLTRFLRQASAMVRGCGREFYTHIDCGMEPGPDGRAQYDMHWGWRQWLQEGLLDGVTLKQVPIGSRMFCELKEMADARRVPIFETPFIWNYLRDEHWREKVTHLFQRANRFGLAGFMVYECAAVLKSQPDTDKLADVRPGLGELIRAFPRAR